MAYDASFAQLAQAWHTSHGAKVVSIARRGLGMLARSAGVASRADQGSVLWVSHAQAVSPPAAISSMAEGRRNFLVEHLVLGPGASLATLLDHRHPRLLVADIDWCADIGLPAVRRLHRHRPEIDWLLCWDAPSPRWLDTLVHSGARGTVLRSADAAALARAFDAVVSGELWLPRQVMHWLYATIVDVPGGDPASTTPSSSWPADSELTPRESEVAVLMRQGLTNRYIAERLGVSVNTVKKHLASAYEKHGIRSRRQTLL